jgi:Rrf2 family protein
MFSKSCEYGIKAVIFIAQKSLQNERVRLDDIASAIDSPVAFTAKTLQLLSRNNIIHSVMGANGGYEIPKEKIENITLLQLVKIIDGELIYNGCGLGLTECNNDAPCPIHDDFIKVRNELKQMLQNTNILELVNNLGNGLTHLKRILN